MTNTDKRSLYVHFFHLLCRATDTRLAWFISPFYQAKFSSLMPPFTVDVDRKRPRSSFEKTAYHPNASIQGTGSPLARSPLTAGGGAKRATPSGSGARRAGVVSPKKDSAGGSGKTVGNASRKQRANLSRHATCALKLWLHDNFEHPYPSDEQKLQLIKSCHVNISQLNNWFINTRVRYWKPAVERLFKQHLSALREAAKADSTGYLQGKLGEAMSGITGGSVQQSKSQQNAAGANSSTSALAMMICLTSVPQVNAALKEHSVKEKEKVHKQLRAAEAKALKAGGIYN